jgi:hypothetical protein
MVADDGEAAAETGDLLTLVNINSAELISVLEGAGTVGSPVIGAP